LGYEAGAAEADAIEPPAGGGITFWTPYVVGILAVAFAAAIAYGRLRKT